MAQSMASIAGLRGTSQAVLEGTLHLSGPVRLTAPGGGRATAGRPSTTIKAQHNSGADLESASNTRRSVLGLVAGIAVASFARSALAEAKPIKVGPPPPPSGGLPGTENSDEPRDFELPYKNRFYLQPLPPAEAAVRAKESAKDILNVKGLIDKKAWPYVQNDLRLKASYLRYDLNTVISAKPKGEKQPLKELTGKLFDTIDGLDHAAKTKNSAEAEKYYAATKSAIDDVISKLG